MNSSVAERIRTATADSPVTKQGSVYVWREFQDLAVLEIRNELPGTFSTTNKNNVTEFFCFMLSNIG